MSEFVKPLAEACAAIIEMIGVVVMTFGCSREAAASRILETAGKWGGDFERPEQGEYERREPLA